MKVLIVATATGTTYTQVAAQIFNQITGTDYYETSFLPVDGVIIGAPGTTAGGFGLLIDGNSLNTPTGETFRTYSPNGQDTYWRMFNNGTEYGNLYNLDGEPRGVGGCEDAIW